MIFKNTVQRLIVAVDVKVDENDETGVIVQAEKYLCHVCDLLAPLGVTIKINTVARILGARALEYINERELESFLDLKLLDIGNTLENDTAWIAAYAPLILTVSERVKPKAFNEVVAALP